ncbi:MAG: DUF1572 family protein [Vicinamibacterales bacterium]
MTSDFRTTYLRDILQTFRLYKSMGEKSLAQVADADLHRLLDPESNSIAIIVKHMAGNLRSRFTDFLTTDGEKPDRNRDGEFEMPEAASRTELLRGWEWGWSIALAAIEALTPDDLERTVTIRGEPLLVVQVLDRLAAHAAYHVGQIVFLAKHFAGSDWKTLSIPKKRI